MNTPKVSIIVPVYNTERFILTCLQAISNQSYKNIELIIVNDGSRDQSGNLIREFTKSEPRAIYIEQNNQGVSVARNTGILRASGKYLLFCDSDDYYTENAISQLVETAEAEAAEVVVGNYYKKNKLANALVKVKQFGNSIEFLESIVTGINHGGPCTKIFRKSVIGETKFQAGIKFREDTLFLAEILLKEPKIGYIEEPIYVYVQRKGSAVNTINDESLKSSEEVSRKLQSFLEDRISSTALSQMLALDAYSFLVNASESLTDKKLELYLNRAKNKNWNIQKKLALFLAKYRLKTIITVYKKIKLFIDNATAY